LSLTLHDLLRGELTLRAMSLVYTTLLSIVPLLALSFSVLKGLGYHHTLEPVIYRFLEPIGDKATTLTQQTMEFIDKIRGGVLGSLGLVFLLYTSVSMIQKIEESFNFVWRVKEPRSFGRRVSEYISVLLIGPGLIVAALGLLATVRDQSVVRAIAGIAPFGTLLLWLSNWPMVRFAETHTPALNDASAISTCCDIRSFGLFAGMYGVTRPSDFELSCAA